MIEIDTNSIKEIAEQLECNFRAYIHKKNGQMIFIPNEDVMPEIDMDEWNDEIKQLENDYANYFEIDKWTSREAFEMMNDFAEQLTDNKQLQSELFVALNKKKPFREFKFVIDDAGDYRQVWFDFRNKQQHEFVAKQLHFLNSIDEMK
ncbi:MAG: hypothetical protein IPF62_10840 [Bacteroidetes bacterium]|nr:hypothetical protein [Bacteroidota bacterium]MBK9481492.1 hypothetical protein [Bacteroidota bacterium]